MKGKALGIFQEYVYSKYEIGYYQFLELPLVCQQALWVEWFDGVGIYIDDWQDFDNYVHCEDEETENEDDAYLRLMQDWNNSIYLRDQEQELINFLMNLNNG